MANTPMTTKTSAEIIAMFQRRKVRSRPGTTGTISHGCSSKSSDRFIEDSLRKGRINSPKTDASPGCEDFVPERRLGRFALREQGGHGATSNPCVRKLAF